MSFEIKEDDMQKPVSREQRIAALRQELSDLKAELRKTKGQYKRATIQGEIRAVCRELVRLEEC